MSENKLQTIGAYWDTRSEGYRQQIENEHKNGTEDFYVQLFKSLPSPLRVLDLGCGPGFLTGLLASKGHEVTALDFSEKMLEQAKDYVSKVTHKKVNFLRDDAQNPPFENESFDLIVSRNLVWNLEKPVEAYKKWFDLLSPNGQMFVFDGNHYCYLFDKDYAEQVTPKVREENHVLLGVSTTVIDELAKELPLSHTYRPYWDERVLNEIGFTDIKFEILKTKTSSTNRVLPLSFYISCKKR